MLADAANPWLFGAAFSGGMVLVDGLDGYLAASTLSLAARGEANARFASTSLGILVVVFSFGLGGAELAGYEINHVALPLGLTLFALVIGIRVWARGRGAPRVASRTAGTARSRRTRRTHEAELLVQP